MRNNKVEKLVLLPFSIGCVTESSVATVAVNHPPQSALRRKKEEEDEESSSSTTKESWKVDLHEKVQQQLPNTKPQNIDNNNINFDRLFMKIKCVKNLSNLFAGKLPFPVIIRSVMTGWLYQLVKHISFCTIANDNMELLFLLSVINAFLKYIGYYGEETEGEETEEEMEIGAPTDVKHVTHIGIGTSSSVLSSGVSNALTGTNDKAADDANDFRLHHHHHHRRRRNSSTSGSSDQLRNLLMTHFPSPSAADQNNHDIF